MQAITQTTPTSDIQPNAATPELIQRAASGNHDAWNQLVSLYARRLYALALSRLRSTHAAEDLTQSVFTTLAEQFARNAYTETGSFEPWLFRIANNRIRDEARKQQRKHQHLPDHSHESQTSEHPDEEQLDELRAAINQLPQAEQELLSLRHQAQMSFKDIASLCDQPLGTILARHHRALNKLRDLMTEPEA